MSKITDARLDEILAGHEWEPPIKFMTDAEQVAILTELRARHPHHRRRQMTDELMKQERCPHCDLNWSLSPPVAVSGSDLVLCIKCKSTFPATTAQTKGVSIHNCTVVDVLGAPVSDQTKGDDLVERLLAGRGIGAALADDKGKTGRFAQAVMDEAASRIQSLTASNEALERERDEARALSDRLVLEAQGHAQEARTANHTIYSIYQAISGAKGEPGNWHGAQPVIEYVQAAQAEIARMREALETAADEFDGTVTGAERAANIARTALTPQEPA